MPPPNKQFFVQITSDEKQFRNEPDQRSFVLWSHCVSQEETVILAAHKFVRESGVAKNPDFSPFEIMLWIASVDAPRHPSGRLAGIYRYIIRIRPNAQPEVVSHG